jgi:hypothetical protein
MRLASIASCTTMRYVLVRGEDGTETMISESPLPAEKKLHDVLTEHPGLLPAEDLDLRDPVVVGREANLESGYADLVLVDQAGQICLVEVKNEGNPDARRVVAQLLDYAAALWQLSVEEFGRVVLGPFLRASSEPVDASLSIAEYVRSSATSDQSVLGAGDEALLAGLEQSLSTGRFRLVVAAPSIPQRLEKVMEYLNAQGHMVYGLEVGFFSGTAECFVPHLTVKPRVSEIRAATTKAEPVSEPDFLESLPAHAQASVRSFLEAARAARASVAWNSYGPGLRPARYPERLIAFAEKRRVAIVINPPKEFPSEPFETARQEIDSLGVGTASADRWEHSVKYEDTTEHQLTAYLEIAINLLNALTPNIDFTKLNKPLTALFERNDNIIWAKSSDVLEPYTGKWLRGTLRASGGEAKPLSLEPVKGGQAGWLPRFSDSTIQASLWPPSVYSGSYELNIDEVA